MLQIKLPPREFYDERIQEFRYTKECTLVLEHSLLSVSKWESRTHKCFIDPFNEMTPGMTEEYIKCMIISPKEVDPLVLYSLPAWVIRAVLDYIHNPMSGTTFSAAEEKKHVRPKKISSEELYWQMVEYGIPFEAEKWHLNRLLTLLKICGIKNTPSKKSKKGGMDGIARARLNASRRAKRH